MKTSSFTVIAALAAISSVNAWDPEFMRGAQTGMFLTSDDQFEDYSCPLAQVKPSIQAYLDMMMPMSMMMKNMNGGEPTPWVDMAIEAAQTIGRLSSIFDENYDGGEFCRGLLLAKEASYVMFKIGNKVMNQGAAKPVASQSKSNNKAVNHASYSDGGVKTHHSNLQANPRLASQDFL